MKTRAHAFQLRDPHAWPLARNAHIITQLIQREILGRYRGSVLGMLWSLITPLLMLAIYTFVFGTIFKTRWSESGTATSEFAILLFVGLIVFQLFAEVVNRAPGLVLANVNYVKKVVFPLEILPLVALGSALFHAAVSFVILLVFMLFAADGIPFTVLWLPIVIAPFVILVLGLAWFLASIGVYVRDISQILGTLVTALMFLSPIFFPSSALPEWIRPYLALNPLTFPIEQIRAVLIWGRMPDLIGLGIYMASAVVVAALGYIWFQKTRKGFADVI